MIDPSHIRQACHSLLGRAPEGEAEIARYAAMSDLPAAIASMIETEEYQALHAEGARQARALAIDFGHGAAHRSRPKPDPYLAPDDLELSDIGPHRMLLIGACFMFTWPEILAQAGVDSVHIDRILFAHSIRLPAAPPAPPETYDVQIVQVPLPSIVPDLDYMRLPYDDIAAHKALFEQALRRMDLFLDEALAWSDRIPAFVLNYMTPQQNLLGRLMPRFDIRNPIHFVERLNQALDQTVARRRNARVLDVNHIGSVFGRRFIQEDMLWHQFHGQMMEGCDRELDIDKSLDVSQFYDTALPDYVFAVWREIRAAFRVLKGADAVKLVCVDLDNTLWRHVIGDLDAVTPYQIIGWPTGLLEVLLYLKRRGIILAILSKNDEARVRAQWDDIFEGKLRLDDFAALRINWQPKPDNLADMLVEVNILPKNVLFLDDNPIERAAMKAAFPEVRTIDTSHYYWRRILAASAELQVASITCESSRRTEMVQAQIGRERVREAMSREEFLASLDLRVTISAVRTPEDPRFARALELVNKTNQFNTTGQRWSEQEARSFLEMGGTWWTFDVTDRFSAYGLVGVVCVTDARIAQFVMSCRVAGLDLESAVLASICPRFADADGMVEAVIRPTAYNAVLADIYRRLGWTEADGLWRGPAALDPLPHVRFLATEMDNRTGEAVDERASNSLPERRDDHPDAASVDPAYRRATGSGEPRSGWRKWFGF